MVMSSDVAALNTSVTHTSDVLRSSFTPSSSTQINELNPADYPKLGDITPHNKRASRRIPGASTRNIESLPKLPGMRGEPAPAANQPRTEQSSGSSQSFRVYTPEDLNRARQERKNRTRGMVKTLGKWMVGVSFRLGYPLALVYAVVEGYIPMLT